MEETTDLLDSQFLTKYATLLAGYCVKFKSDNATSRTIVYGVPPECDIIRPYLERAIFERGYTAFDKDTILVELKAPIIYLEIVGDNVVKPLYSVEALTPLKFKKEHVLLSPFPTPNRALLAALPYEQYVDNFKKVYLLDSVNPLEEWAHKLSEIKALKEKLNALQIQKVQVKSETMNLEFSVGEERQWLGASGKNLPSFEVFISPDWRTVNGSMQCNIPLNKYGHSIENIHFQFKHGKLTGYTCKNQKEYLDSILNQPLMDRVGEFSLTDKRISTVKTYLASTILDENFGGNFGNSHIALGRSYIRSYTHYSPDISLKDLVNLGFNDSLDHIDFINSLPKEVFATNRDKGTFLLYKDGEFQL